MYRSILYSFCFLIFYIPIVNSQTGGKVFQFLELTNASRIAALNGNVPVLQDDDINIAYINPSGLNFNLNHNFSMNFINYFAGINYYYSSYAYSFDSLNTIALGINYIDYGKFLAADEFGNINGNFFASEYAIFLQYSRLINKNLFSGLTVKPVISQLEKYSSTGLAFDIGITYISDDKLFKSALVLRNLGFQITKYYDNAKGEELPLNIIVGFTKKFAYSPLIVYFVFDHLEKFDLTYKTEKQKEEETNQLTGETKKISSFDKSFDKLMRHLNLGFELNLTKNIFISVGYNYRRRQEMKIDELPGTVGISWGVGLRFNKFQFYYARSTYHLYGSPNYFSINLKMNEIFKLF